MTRRAFHRATDGVSVVVGAILLVSLLVLASLSVRTNYTPIWDENKEAASLRNQQGQLGTLQANIGRIAANASAVSLTAPITLGTSESGFLGSKESPQRLAFTPNDLTVSLGAKALIVQEEGTSSYYGMPESWLTVQGTETLTDIHDVRALRIKLALVERRHSGDAVRLSINDATGAFAGAFRIYITTQPSSNFVVRGQTINAANQVVYDQGATFAAQDVQAPYWVDALPAETRFAAIIAGAKKPLSMSVQVQNVGSGGSNADLAAEYAITYGRMVNGVLVLEGGGTSLTDYSKTYKAGSITLDAVHQRLIDQTFRYEYGGLVRTQSDGSTLWSPPVMQIRPAGSLTKVDAQFILPQGSEDQRSGTRTIIVAATALEHSSLVGRASNLTLRMMTSSPASLLQAWTGSLTAIPGFSAGEEFVLRSGPDWAELQLWGPTFNPSSTELDVALDLDFVTIGVQFQG